MIRETKTKRNGAGFSTFSMALTPSFIIQDLYINTREGMGDKVVVVPLSREDKGFAFIRCNGGPFLLVRSFRNELPWRDHYALIPKLLR